MTGESSKEAPVLFDLRAGIGWVTLNRPRQLNAMNGALMEQLASTLEGAAADPAVRCVVIKAAGDSFCAGGDLGEISARQEETEALSTGAAIERHRRKMLRDVRSITLLHAMPKPTIAMVRGYAIGGGLSIALAADLRIASTTAKLRAGFAQRSLSGDFGITFLLTEATGGAKARELMLLDPMLDAEAGLQLGLLTEVVDDEALQGRTEAVAEALANGPTIALGCMKDNLIAAASQDLDDVMAREALNQRISANTADAAEAGRAFSDRREPRFSGR